jgi:FkbM family methyltransferase
LISGCHTVATGFIEIEAASNLAGYAPVLLRFVKKARPMPLSYTQNMEDYHLAIAFEGQDKGFYVDVGAGHPVADNVSLWFYERGWNGIVAEPQTALAQLYPRIRPKDLLYQGLLGREHGTATFFQFDRLHGLSTTVAAHANSAEAFGDTCHASTLPMITLATLLENHDVQEIDFLKIDVEGAEADVIAGNDWERFRPKIVVVEAVSAGGGDPNWHHWELVLLSNGYRFRLFDTLNRFYVANEHDELFHRLPPERAPWDAVTHMYEIGRAPESALHPDHCLAEQLLRGFWPSLPHLDDNIIAELLNRGVDGKHKASFDISDVERIRIALGRIACGYDGGQVSG